jgi:hypothetical protein
MSMAGWYVLFGVATFLIGFVLGTLDGEGRR